MAEKTEKRTLPPAIPEMDLEDSDFIVSFKKDGKATRHVMDYDLVTQVLSHQLHGLFQKTGRMVVDTDEQGVQTQREEMGFDVFVRCLATGEKFPASIPSIRMFEANAREAFGLPEGIGSAGVVFTFNAWCAETKRRIALKKDTGGSPG